MDRDTRGVFGDYISIYDIQDDVDGKAVMIKRLLKKYKYPPEGEEEATALVLKQAEALAEGWAQPIRAGS